MTTSKARPTAKRPRPIPPRSTRPPSPAASRPSRLRMALRFDHVPAARRAGPHRRAGSGARRHVSRFGPLPVLQLAHCLAADMARERTRVGRALAGAGARQHPRRVQPVPAAPRRRRKFKDLDVHAQVAADALAVRHHAAEALLRLACARLAPSSSGSATRQGCSARPRSTSKRVTTRSSMASPSGPGPTCGSPS
jgi:hypothetical protein